MTFLNLQTPSKKIFSLDISTTENDLIKLISCLSHINENRIKGLCDMKGHYYTFTAAINNQQGNFNYSKVYSIVFDENPSGVNKNFKNINNDENNNNNFFGNDYYCDDDNNTFKYSLCNHNNNNSFFDRRFRDQENFYRENYFKDRSCMDFDNLSISPLRNNFNNNNNDNRNNFIHLNNQNIGYSDYYNDNDFDYSNYNINNNRVISAKVNNNKSNLNLNNENFDGFINNNNNKENKFFNNRYYKHELINKNNINNNSNPNRSYSYRYQNEDIKNNFNNNKNFINQTLQNKYYNRDFNTIKHNSNTENTPFNKNETFNKSENLNIKNFNLQPSEENRYNYLNRNYHINYTDNNINENNFNYQQYNLNEIKNRKNYNKYNTQRNKSIIINDNILNNNNQFNNLSNNIINNNQNDNLNLNNNNYYNLNNASSNFISNFNSLNKNPNYSKQRPNIDINENTLNSNSISNSNNYNKKQKKISISENDLSNNNNINNQIENKIFNRKSKDNKINNNTYNEYYIKIANDLVELNLIEDRLFPKLKQMLLNENEDITILFKLFCNDVVEIESLVSGINKILSKINGQIIRPDSPEIFNKNQLIKLIESLNEGIFDDPSDLILLKNLANSNNEFILSAYELYLSDNDIENFIDSLKRFIKKQNNPNNFYGKNLNMNFTNNEINYNNNNLNNNDNKYYNYNENNNFNNYNISKNISDLDKLKLKNYGSKKSTEYFEEKYNMNMDMNMKYNSNNNYHNNKTINNPNNYNHIHNNDFKNNNNNNFSAEFTYENNQEKLKIKDDNLNNNNNFQKIEQENIKINKTINNNNNSKTNSDKDIKSINQNTSKNKKNSNMSIKKFNKENQTSANNNSSNNNTNNYEKIINQKDLNSNIETTPTKNLIKKNSFINNSQFSSKKDIHENIDNNNSVKKNINLNTFNNNINLTPSKKDKDNKNKINNLNLNLESDETIREKNSLSPERYPLTRDTLNQLENILKFLHTEQRIIFKYALKNKLPEVNIFTQLRTTIDSEDILLRTVKVFCKQFINEKITKNFEEKFLNFFKILMQKRDQNLLGLFKEFYKHNSLETLRSEILNYLTLKFFNTNSKTEDYFYNNKTQSSKKILMIDEEKEEKNKNKIFERKNRDRKKFGTHNTTKSRKKKIEKIEKFEIKRSICSIDSINYNLDNNENNNFNENDDFNDNDESRILKKEDFLGNFTNAQKNSEFIKIELNSYDNNNNIVNNGSQKKIIEENNIKKYGSQKKIFSMDFNVNDNDNNNNNIEFRNDKQKEFFDLISSFNFIVESDKENFEVLLNEKNAEAFEIFEMFLKKKNILAVKSNIKTFIKKYFHNDSKKYLDSYNKNNSVYSDNSDININNAPKKGKLEKSSNISISNNNNKNNQYNQILNITKPGTILSKLEKKMSSEKMIIDNKDKANKNNINITKYKISSGDLNENKLKKTNEKKIRQIKNNNNNYFNFNQLDDNIHISKNLLSSSEEKEREKKINDNINAINNLSYSSLKELLKDLENSGKISSHQQKYILQRYNNKDYNLLKAWEAYTENKCLPDLIESLKKFSTNARRVSNVITNGRTPVAVTESKNDIIEFLKVKDNSREKDEIKKKQINIIKILVKEKMIDEKTAPIIYEMINNENHFLISAFEIFSVSKDHWEFCETLDMITDVHRNNYKISDVEDTNINNNIILKDENDNNNNRKLEFILENFITELKERNDIDKNAFIFTDDEFDSFRKMLFENDEFFMSALEFYGSNFDKEEFIENLKMLN
jgi:hypothetical protein